MGGLVYCHDCFRSFDPATPLCPQCGAARTRIENGSVTDGAKAKLFAVRATRVRPHLDDMVLCSWNGMMLGALSRAGST